MYVLKLCRVPGLNPRALSNAADDGLLTESFFWIPSLGGPTTIAARNAVRARIGICAPCTSWCILVAECRQSLRIMV